MGIFLSEAAAVRVTYCIKTCIRSGYLSWLLLTRGLSGIPEIRFPGILSRNPLCTILSALLLTTCDKNRSSSSLSQVPTFFLRSFQSLWASENRMRNIAHLIPFLGELCGEVGGEDSCEDALETVSSDCFLWRSKLPSSDKERIFFKACGELMPLNKN